MGVGPLMIMMVLCHRLFSYDVRISSASFPARGYMVINHIKRLSVDRCLIIFKPASRLLKEKYAEKSYLHPFHVKQQWQRIKESLLEVNVFFQTFDLLKTEETPQHTVSPQIFCGLRCDVLFTPVYTHL